MNEGKRPGSYYALATVFGLFVIFLYGPMVTIFVLSFQGPEGGLTFRCAARRLHWFAKTVGGHGRGRHRRGVSPPVALGRGGDVVHRCCCRSVPALAFRRKFSGSGDLVLHLGRQPDRAVHRGSRSASACSSG